MSKELIKGFQDKLNQDLVKSILEPDYSREFGMACWCEDMELCQNEEH